MDTKECVAPESNNTVTHELKSRMVPSITALEASPFPSIVGSANIRGVLGVTTCFPFLTPPAAAGLKLGVLVGLPASTRPDPTAGVNGGLGGGGPFSALYLRSWGQSRFKCPF